MLCAIVSVGGAVGRGWGSVNLLDHHPSFTQFDNIPLNLNG